MEAKERLARRKRRHLRVRRKIFGTAERPRLCVFRSLRYICAQIIDDERGVTLASVSTMEKALRDGLSSTKSVEAAKRAGAAIAERARAKNIEKVVFDRGGYRYHGRVKAFAEAAREGGLVL